MINLCQDAVGFKALVTKLSGFAKFEVDTKITKLQFFHLVEESATDVIEGEAAEGEEAPVSRSFNQDAYNQISDAWEKAIKGGNPPFAGDLENPCYLRMLQAMRDFKPENYPAPEEQM